MPKNHLINEIDQLRECPYCHNNLTKNEWGSIFHLQHHYKETSCQKCARTISIRVNFNGSGHDCWDCNSEFCKKVKSPSIKVKTLEEKIK